MTKATAEPSTLRGRRIGAPRVEQSSFRDPAGFVFHHDGVVYRHVNHSHRDDFEHLTACGLYRRLIDDGLLIPHRDVTLDAARLSPSPEAVYRVIRPQRIPLVTYPYEWCFSHLRDAALATLAVQRRALAHGMSLRDASAFNIQFIDGRHILIDTLSLERYREHGPWIAYRQFCQHFLAPLALMSYCDARLGDLLRVHLDGIPLDLAARLLPLRTRISPRLGPHLHLHAWMQRTWRGANEPEPRPTQRGFSRRSMDFLLGSLETTIRRLRSPRQESTWSAYYSDMTHYPAGAVDAKRKFVEQEIKRFGPKMVWDLGANTGAFSLLAASHAELVASWDMDRTCVEKNYVSARSDASQTVMPLVLDLSNPSPSQGWAHRERRSLVERGPADLVLALGLVHHLAIAGNVPLDRVASYLSRLSRNLLVEFIPKQDLQVRRMLSSRQDVFADYDQERFERAFGLHFAVEQHCAIRGTCRTVYAMRGRAP